MRVRVDAQSDAIYLDLTLGAIDSSEEVAEGIILDYDVQGRLVGIEILDASKKSQDNNTLHSLTMELGKVA
ncbi:MAG: DUF2283 domain-containing protein [Nitrospirae bacterium]|nr:DUF2283 domain-containing protein [Magnetococcales bacterium]HAT49914.1 DUF2283 domain-containing protein [Alphaproteobacteria bacterium]